MLHVEEWGEGPNVGLIHGFTQSARSWQPVASRLTDRWRLVAVDAPGHGRSAGVAADLWRGSDLIGDAIGPAAYVGYSMGGRLALHLALLRADLVRCLVLVSATGGIDDPAARDARRVSDEDLALRIEAQGVEEFVTWWLTRPLFATLPAGAAGVETRLGGSAEGLASSLRLAGTGTQEPLWDRLGALPMPVLVIAGRLDTAYCDHARRLVAAIGASASLQLMEGAGHACHLERPDEFAAILRAWLPDPGPRHPPDRAPQHPDPRPNSTPDHSDRPSAKSAPKAKTS